MPAFTVVLALLAVAGLGWLLSWAARRLLRRHGVRTDEREEHDDR
jgi:protein-S-isoprenylcysteine O-methyltransferase Ste14